MNCKTVALARDEPWRIGFIGRPDLTKIPRSGLVFGGWKGNRRARRGSQTVRERFKSIMGVGRLQGQWTKSRERGAAGAGDV